MEASEFPTCAVCGRTMLRGERINEYLDERRAEMAVCSLCKPRAEAEGWVPAELADSLPPANGSRRRLGIGTALRERLTARRAAPQHADAPAAEIEETPPPEPEPPRVQPAPAEPEPELDAVALEPSEPEPDPEPPRELTPFEAFNESEEARKVAGLMRSLGEPRVTLRDETITVAWELSWYQWRVSAGRVEQVAKGDEISEIDGPDRLWNGRAESDGTLSLA